MGRLHCVAYNLCFYGCWCSCGPDLWSLFSVFWSASAFAGWKWLAGSAQHDAMIETENIHFVFCSLSFCGESLLKPDLLPHASVHKEVCFLSGQYICSCQQAGQQLTFDLTLIQRNVFGHSIQPPVIGYQCLSSMLVWSLHFLISVLCITRSKLLCNWFYK